MAERNIQIKQRNATNNGWDNLYPRTKASIVQTDGGLTVEEHITDNSKHITSSERTSWNNKQNALGFTPENTANKGVSNGYASLDSSGKIPVSQLPPNAKEIRIVKDITARNNYPDKYEGLRIHVKDASADSTVKSGWAEYLWDGTNWTKTAEKESIDVVLDATNIEGVMSVENIPNLPPSKITQNASNRFVTDAEKTTWNNKSNVQLGETSSTAYRGDRGKIAYDHSQITHAPSNAQKNSDITKAEIEAKLTGVITSHTHESGTPTKHANTHVTGSDVIPNAVSGGNSGLMSGGDKAKLDGIAINANNYIHPSSHPASMITESTTRRFVSDSEKLVWNGKQKAITVSSTLPTSPEANELVFEII